VALAHDLVLEWGEREREREEERKRDRERKERGRERGRERERESRYRCYIMIRAEHIDRINRLNT